MTTSPNSQRLKHFSLLNAFILIASLITSFASSAIIIRHDKKDKDYQLLAQKYQATMAYLDICVGTVIDNYWVITAAHCVSPTLDYPVKITHLNKAYPVDNIIVHPEFGENHDIALIKLKWPLTNAKPAKLYIDNNELNQRVVFVGNGKTGTGLTGDKSLDYVTRAATNTVSTIEPYWLTFTFDNPNIPNSGSTLLEGVSGNHDSGGPAFIEHNDTLYIAGVGCCQVPAMNDAGVEIQGSYGSTEYYSRVSAHVKWIKDNLSTNLYNRTHKLPTDIAIALHNDDINKAHQLLLQSASWNKNTDLVNELLLTAIYANKIEFIKHLFKWAPEIKNARLQNQPLAKYVYQYGSAELFELLVNLDIDLNHHGFQDQDYLSLITWQYHQFDYEKLVNVLLNNGFDINRQDKRGDSALHLAGFYGNADRIKYLVEKGANIDLADNNGNTVLMDMARKGNVELLSLLLQLGANTALKNKAGNTALQIALENKQNDTAKVLQEYL